MICVQPLVPREGVRAGDVVRTPAIVVAVRGAAVACNKVESFPMRRLPESWGGQGRGGSTGWEGGGEGDEGGGGTKDTYTEENFCTRIREEFAGGEFHFFVTGA